MAAVADEDHSALNTLREKHRLRAETLRPSISTPTALSGLIMGLVIVLVLMIMGYMLFELQISEPVVEPNVRTSKVWLWGCYGKGADCSIVPSWLWEEMMTSPAPFTGIFPGFGHSLSGAYTIKVPKNNLAAAQLVAKAHALNMTVEPVIEYGQSGQRSSSSDYKKFVRNRTAQDCMIAAFTADAAAYNYDGYNFDWEFKAYTKNDAALMASFVDRFAMALAPRTLSTDQADMRYSNTGLVDQPNYRAYDMATYTQNKSVFNEVLGRGLGAGRGLDWGIYGSDAAHFGVGLSCSTTSWTVPGGPTRAEIKERFCYLESVGVKHVALYLGNADFVDAFLPFLRSFVSGAPACPQPEWVPMQGN